ncbi:MAG: type II secretion system protein [Aquificaceae bacterium]
MCGSKGFTLLELLVAITLVAVGFSVVFEVLSKARLDYSYARSLSEDLIELNNLLVKGDADPLISQRKTLEDYPQIEEINYRLGQADILLYRVKDEKRLYTP